MNDDGDGDGDDDDNDNDGDDDGDECMNKQTIRQSHLLSKSWTRQFGVKQNHKESRL